MVDTAVPGSLPRTQQERRQRIIAAAVALLEEGEYDTVQMRDVAERAGVALATIYRYFTSKEHLYAAALLDWAADYPVKGRALDRSNGGGEARFRALMRRAVRAFERHPQMMRALIVLESSNTAAAVVETANAVMVTRLRSWALGRCSIRDVDRSVQRALDLIFSYQRL